VTSEALEIGYRHIDTATIYKNERGVGKAIRESGIPRDDLYITTKLWNGDQPKARDAISSSLDRLGLEHVDLYLIHWPAPERGTYIEAWRALEHLKDDGLTTSIGVSNFLPEHLDALKVVSDTVPVLNQVELHPLLQQTVLRSVHAERGIATESWGPLGHGSVDLAAEAPLLAVIAEAHGKSVAQVVLRWHVQEGLIVFPKTSHKERLLENISIFDFHLSDDDMDSIRALDRDQRVGTHPLDGNWD
jgi:2,5-diketo-D-gluconate reductase A